MSKVIDEIKEITANEVAKKNDAAKLNFPKILEKIKAAAAKGASQCNIGVTEMNEYDQRLLESEGFKVRLVDIPKDPFDKINYYKEQFLDAVCKQWEIRW